MALKPPEEFSDADFIDKMERNHDRNPLFRFKPESLARLYRLAGMEATADQFETFVERISLPTMPWVCQQARARLTGVEPGAYDAVMSERAMIVRFLRDVVRLSPYATKILERDVIPAIERGDHRVAVKMPGPGELIEERQV